LITPIGSKSRLSGVLEQLSHRLAAALRMKPVNFGGLWAAFALVLSICNPVSARVFKTPNRRSMKGILNTVGSSAQA
jgi:hypothetical protein